MNPFKKYPVISVLAGGIIGGFATLYILDQVLDIKSRMREWLSPPGYGTVERPNYFITKKFEPTDSNFSQAILPRYFAFQNLIADITKLLEDLEQNFLSVDAQLRYAEERFEKDGAEVGYRWMKENHLGKEIQKLTENNTKIYSMNEYFQLGYLADRVMSGIDPNSVPEVNAETAAKEAFMELTGRKFPSNLKIEKEDIAFKDWVEYYSSLEGRIAYEDLSSADNFLNLTHAFGHVCAQHDEKMTNQEIFEIRILEEACAYAFTRACLDYAYRQAKTKELASIGKFLFEESILEKARSFYKEEDDAFCHGAGAAHFIAAFQIFQDPYITSNYLATVKGSSPFNIHPKIAAQIVRNKAIFTANDILEDVVKVDAKVEYRNEVTWSLFARYTILLKMCREHGINLEPADWAYLKSHP